MICVDVVEDQIRSGLSALARIYLVQISCAELEVTLNVEI
jgi:hypothetical protein